MKTFNQWMQAFTAPLLLIILASFSLASNAETLPKHSPVPGGIAVIKLPATEPLETPSAYYRDQRVMVKQLNSQWFAIVGIPLSATPGTHDISTSTGQRISFDITDKHYREQRITLSNKRMVTPAPLDLDRIRSEKKLMQAAFKHWHDQPPATLTFIKPVDGPYSSPFGLRRFFNDQPRNPHSGIDIAAPEGSPIRAPAAGVVTATGNYFFNGNTILLDHGHGLVSMFCHLSKTNVQEGEQVNTADIIGEVRKTGRVTGPRLHWSVSLNNARINPFLLMTDKSNEP